MEGSCPEQVVAKIRRPACLLLALQMSVVEVEDCQKPVLDRVHRSGRDLLGGVEAVVVEGSSDQPYVRENNAAMLARMQVDTMIFRERVTEDCHLLDHKFLLN